MRYLYYFEHLYYNMTSTFIEYYDVYIRPSAPFDLRIYVFENYVQKSLYIMNILIMNNIHVTCMYIKYVVYTYNHI